MLNMWRLVWVKVSCYVIFYFILFEIRRGDGRIGFIGDFILVLENVERERRGGEKNVWRRMREIEKMIFIFGWVIYLKIG